MKHTNLIDNLWPANSEEVVLTGILETIIKPGLNWEIKGLDLIQTHKRDHSLINSREFLFKYQNLVTISKNEDAKAWFLYEDYQLKLMRYLKRDLGADIQQQTGPYSIYSFVLVCEDYETEIVVMVADSLKGVCPKGDLKVA